MPLPFLPGKTSRAKQAQGIDKILSPEQVCFEHFGFGFVPDFDIRISSLNFY